MADFNLTTTAVSPTTIDRDDLRTRLRQELHDEDSANSRWTDAVLNRHIDRAVRELSAVWPRERKTTAQTAAGSRDVSVTLDQLVRIEAVEYPTGEWPPAFVQWQLYGSALTLLLESAPAAVADVNVYWGQLHAVDATQSTLPTAAEDAVGTGAGGGVGAVRPPPAASPLGQTGKRAIWQTGPSTGLRTGRRANGQRR